jgi:hypothetical protein
MSDTSDSEAFEYDDDECLQIINPCESNEHNGRRHQDRQSSGRSNGGYDVESDVFLTDVDDDDDDELQQDDCGRSGHGGHGGRSGHGEDEYGDNYDDDNGVDGESSDNCDGPDAHQQQQPDPYGLESLPGFSEQIMGSGIDPHPAVFVTGLSGSWVQWSTKKPLFSTDGGPRPARVLCLCFPADFVSSDASRIGDFATLEDLTVRSRQVTAAALLGMMSAGTDKGWIACDHHSEFDEAKEAEKDVEKVKKQLNGNLKSYTYRPEPSVVAPQFSWALEELYDPTKTRVIAVRILKLIYCVSHSDDLLWRNLMEESNEISRSGNINSVPETIRSQRFMTQNKLQRMQIDDENLEITTTTQWKRITSMSTLVKHFNNHAGAQNGHRGRPLYGNICRDVAAGMCDRPLKASEYGGLHPLGPSVALNFKRYEPPSEHSPGVNVSIAGTVDVNGNPLKLLPCQCDPTQYFLEDGTFSPPTEVLELGAIHFLHDTSIKNVMNVPFARPIQGSVVAEDPLLRMYFDLRRYDDKMLRRTQIGPNGPEPFEEVREVVTTAFNGYLKERDEEAEAISRGILSNEMLSFDCLDKTVAETDRLDRRAYEKRSVSKHGDMWVLEPRQVLKDISQEIERCFGLIDESDRNYRLEVLGTTATHSRNREAAHVERRKSHAEKVDSCIRFGLRRFHQAYASKKLSTTIPPGWKDVCFNGLHAAMRETAELSTRSENRKSCATVDPEDPNAKNGTANLAFAHNQSLCVRDITPWGHWRCFLINMLASGVRIQGRDVHVMLECWNHAFEPCVLKQPQTNRPPANLPTRQLAMRQPPLYSWQVSRGLVLLLDVRRTRHGKEHARQAASKGAVQGLDH